MRFLRHDGIYRSDVSLLLINPVQMPPPVGRPRYRAIGRAGRNYTSCPSSAMSSDRLILDRVGRHQSPSPLHRYHQNKSLAFRPASNYHRTAGSVLTVCVSRGDKPTRYRCDLDPGIVLRSPVVNRQGTRPATMSRSISSWSAIAFHLTGVCHHEQLLIVRAVLSAETV
jgi:hypothetical protein